MHWGIAFHQGRRRYGVEQLLIRFAVAAVVVVVGVAGVMRDPIKLCEIGMCSTECSKLYLQQCHAATQQYQWHCRKGAWQTRPAGQLLH